MGDLSIYTLNARDNFLLEFTKKHFNLSDEIMHNTITHAFNECLGILKSKNISYSELKSALIPSIDRQEIALVFDTCKIESAWYGKPVFDKIIELFHRDSSHSILVGDYLENRNIEEILKHEFLSTIISDQQIDYKQSSQFYIVYLNNLSDVMVKRFDSGLKKYDPYVGYFELSNESFMKNYLSTILIKPFIMSGNCIIQGHEDDLDNSENVNMSGYNFEKNGYTCKSLQSIYFDLFLSYKIERGVYAGFESDTTLSINAISPIVFDIHDFKVIIEDAKFNYLLDSHFARIKKAGMIKLTSDELENFIKEKIASNYIYNMTFLREHSTLKFNIIIETTAEDSNEAVKLLVALEFLPKDKILRLITMF